MIENQHQYQISQQKLAELITEINEVTKSPLHPLRNKLLLASLTQAKQELEVEIFLYKESSHQH